MTLRRSFLLCGILSSLTYAATDVAAAVAYPDYHSFTSRVVSELMANGAPTERLVDPLFLLYGVLLIAFALGVWMSGDERRVRVTGGLLLAVGVIGLPGPIFFEMNVRGSGPSTADTLHIALTAVLGTFILASVAVGAFTRGRWFRAYSIATLAILVVAALLTSLESGGMATGEPTPWIGLWERISIGGYLAWVAVLAVALWRVPEPRPRTHVLPAPHPSAARVART